MNLLIKNIKRAGRGFTNFDNYASACSPTVASNGRLTGPHQCEAAPPLGRVAPDYSRLDVYDGSASAKRSRSSTKHFCLACWSAGAMR